MGLNIEAFSQLKPARGVFINDDDETISKRTGKARAKSCVELYDNLSFPGRAAPFKQGIYSYDQRFFFNTGSYTAYSEWREQLAKLVGWPKTKGSHARSAYEATSGPMWELINFSDCEGTLGTAACKKLVKEFKHFEEKADHHLDMWYRQKYADWQKALTLASKGGAVQLC